MQQNTPCRGRRRLLPIRLAAVLVTCLVFLASTIAPHPAATGDFAVPSSSSASPFLVTNQAASSINREGRSEPIPVDISVPFAFPAAEQNKSSPETSPERAPVSEPVAESMEPHSTGGTPASGVGPAGGPGVIMEGGEAAGDLKLSIEEYLDNLSGAYGVAIRNLQSDQTVLVNADQPFPAASTYKLLVMYRAYEQIEYGLLDAEEWLTIREADAAQDWPYMSLYPGESVTVAQALEAAITVSNNAASHALARRVGGWGHVEAAATELGMYQTWLEDEYFWTTPLDMINFFELLAAGQMVSEEASNSMLDLLRRQRINNRIPALLPAEAEVAHKTGELPGVKNDVGIVTGPAGSYVIAVLSQWADDAEAVGTIAEIALDAYSKYAAGTVE